MPHSPFRDLDPAARIGLTRVMRPVLIPIAALFLLASCAGAPDFARIDADLRAAGKLRADRNPRDAPFDAGDLLENFARIGFGSEFAIVGGRYVALGRDETAPLTRWAGPVRYTLVGDHDAEDAAEVRAFAGRLADATGLEIGPGARAPNLLIFFLEPEGRARLAESFRAAPEYRPLLDLFEAWADDPAWPCAAEFYYRPAGDPDAYEIHFAAIYIRAEVSGLSRRSCIEEEMAQTMGLARDDPEVRPSIFNDDEEFALMTGHDTALLRLLYDPRLSPGMTAAEALPVARRILGLPEDR